MAVKEAKDIQVYTGSQWKSLKDQQVHDGNGWKKFGAGSGVSDGSDWHVLASSSTGGGNGGGTTTPEKKVNTIRIRKADWIPSQGVFKFGISMELANPPTAEIFGVIKIKRGEKELSYDYNFLPGKTPYITYKSNDDATFDLLRFVSGTINPTEDDKYKYEFVHKKDEIIK